MIIISAGVKEAQALHLPPADRYFDQIAVWLPEKLTRIDIGHLCQLNRSPDPERGSLYVSNKPMKYQPKWRQRIQIRQARHDTLGALAEMIGNNPSLVNYAELASDHGYSGDYSVNDRDDAYDLLDECWIRKYHRRSQGVRHVVDEDEGGNVTRYDGPRKSSNVTVMYQERHARNTGEEHNLHLEWRVTSAQACDRVKLVTVQDAMKFDHDAFWQEKLRHVYRVDSARFGLSLRNRRARTRARAYSFVKYLPWLPRVNMDARLGAGHLAQHDTVQELIDAYGMKLMQPSLTRVLVSVD